MPFTLKYSLKNKIERSYSGLFSTKISEEEFATNSDEILAHRFSYTLYKWVLRTYLKIERVTTSIRPVKAEIWGISKEEKLKLMTVITAWELGMGLARYYISFFNGNQAALIFLLMEDENEHWATIRKTSINKLAGFNGFDETSLIESRVNIYMKKYLSKTNSIDAVEGNFIDQNEAQNLFLKDVTQILGFGSGIAEIFRIEEIGELNDPSWEFQISYEELMNEIEKRKQK